MPKIFTSKTDTFPMKTSAQLYNLKSTHAHWNCNQACLSTLVATLSKHWHAKLEWKKNQKYEKLDMPMVFNNRITYCRIAEQ